MAPEYKVPPVDEAPVTGDNDTQDEDVVSSKMVEDFQFKPQTIFPTSLTCA
ncbi:hypothetical protein [Methanococcoides burtonii]|uniref:hypothetical protein n=1 Tax=Methanococcoides burtonii TaxID=29291 RepID=UPI00003992AC|nr:hypothetical protein [Methanococcoides burtonii]